MAQPLQQSLGEQHRRGLGKIVRYREPETYKVISSAYYRDTIPIKSHQHDCLKKLPEAQVYRAVWLQTYHKVPLLDE